MSDATASPVYSAFSKAIADVVSGAGRSIVGVHSHRLRASGFAWRPGLIVTANEALADEGPVSVSLPGGDCVPATIKGRDASTDIALLAIERIDLPAAPTSPDAAEAGALVVVVGAQEGTAVAALGVVSRVAPAWRSIRGGDMGARIELDVALRTSAEGGLAFDAAGRAIGMAVFGPRRRVLVIPARTVDGIAAKLAADGRVARGYVGVALQPVRIEGASEAAGAMVMSIDPTGPAAAAGLHQGDVITTWNGRAVHGAHALWRELGPGSVGTSARLSARRAGERVDFTVTIGARPEV